MLQTILLCSHKLTAYCNKEYNIFNYSLWGMGKII